MDDSRPTTPSCCASDDAKTLAPSCCDQGSAAAEKEAPPIDASWVEGAASTAIGAIPRVTTTLRFEDRLGAWKARWGIGRMHYRVEPALYAVGRPTPDSPVLVSANYKMSFDRLRSQLGGRDAWVLVLDTRGINVWCAAGKGTLGTDEIVRRAEAVRLAEVVSHRTLVLPQLGAPGVSAHEVRRRSGFRVVYGPVRAEDLPAFLDAGMKAAPQMRRVRFPLGDRVALIPVELILWSKYALLAAACFLLLGGLGPGGYSSARALAVGARCAALLLAAFLAGAVLAPSLLPWLPGRSFSAKGAWIGLVVALGVAGCKWAHPKMFGSWLSAAAWLLIIPATASFLAMNFTGASTYTSLSGVRREVRVAAPIQMACAVAGVGLWLAGRFA